MICERPVRCSDAFEESEMKERICLLVCVAALCAAEVNCESDIFEILSRGLKNLTITDDDRAILVLGNTGSGKSTLVHYLARDPSKIEAVDEGGLYPRVVDHWDVLGENISTTRSRTLVPELTVDERKRVWYDCPGFQDTRSTAFEVANTYFVKALTDRIPNLKIILTINQASVTVGLYREDFLNLMKHTITLLPNVEKFDVGLVLTKADSARARGWKVVEITNDEIIAETVKFLGEYVNDLDGDPQKDKKQKLVDSFLHKSADGKYDHIGVFYRSVENGTFDQIPKMVKERTFILNMVHENVGYTKSEPHDFGYPLSAAAKTAIEKKSKWINKNIKNVLSRIDAYLWGEVKFIEGRRNSLKGRKDHLTDRLRVYENSILNATTIEEFFKGMHRFASNMNVTLSDEDLEELKTQQKYEDILKTLSNHTVMMPASEWVSSLPKTHKNLVDGVNWYSFFGNMVEKLSSYKIQQDPSIYNVQNLSDWGQKNSLQGLIVDAGNADEFFVLMGSKTASSMKITMTATRYDAINQVLKEALRTSAKFECKDDAIVYKGPFVLMSQINPQKCRNAKKIHVLAYEKFFVDKTMDFKGFEEFVLVSDYWEVVRGSTMFLSALNVNYNHPANKDGTKEQPDGIAGKSGISGKPGGNFYGYANYIQKREWFQVESNGANGGRGQDGSRAYPEAPELNKVALEKFKNCNVKKHLMTSSYHYRIIDGRDIPDCYNRDFHYFYDDEEWKSTSPIHARRSKDVHKDYSYTLYARQCCKEDGLAGTGTTIDRVKCAS